MPFAVPRRLWPPRYDVRQSRARFRSITGVTAPVQAEPEEEVREQEAAETAPAVEEEDVPVIDVIL